MPVEENFTATKNICWEVHKILKYRSSPKHLLGFSYICLKYYELDQNFEFTIFKNQTTHPTIKLNYFTELLWSLRNNCLMRWVQLMVRPFRKLWSNVQNYIQSKNKCSLWHKATHKGNCNKNDCPYIEWEKLWRFSFRRNFAKWTTKTCKTIKQVDQEIFPVSGAETLL